MLLQNGCQATLLEHATSDYRKRGRFAVPLRRAASRTRSRLRKMRGEQPATMDTAERPPTDVPGTTAGDGTAG